MCDKTLTLKEEDRLVWATAEKPFPRSPSFERRVTTLVATFLFLLCGMADQYAKGAFFATVTIGSGELLLLIFRNGFAFEVVPADLDESKSWLDDFFHPIAIALYVVATAAILLFEVRDSKTVFIFFTVVTSFNLLLSAVVKLAASFMELADEGMT
jgi:hypothetical protein